MHGTDDIRTSGGYFHMANVFYRQNKLDVAFSLYNQVRQFHDDCIELTLSLPQVTKTEFLLTISNTQAGDENREEYQLWDY